MTDWDVKKAFSKYSNFNGYFPLIYIDDYWNYYIDSFGLKESYENFRELFKKEFKGFGEFRNTMTETIKNTSRKLFNTNRSEALIILQDSINHIDPLNGKYDQIIYTPDGKYLQVDLHKAFDTVLKKIAIFNNNYESTTDIIKDVTKSELIPTLKWPRILSYVGALSQQLSNCFLNCKDLLNKIYKSDHQIIQMLNQKYELTTVGGDMYLYNIGDDDLTNLVGDYEIDGIPFSISLYELKTVNILGQKNKLKICTSSNKIDYVIGYTDKGHILPELFPLAISLYKGKEPNEKDLAIGYEDKIYFYLNENDNRLGYKEELR